MADPEQFVAATTLGDGRPAPEAWGHLTGPPWLAVFSARLPDTDREVAVFTPESAATDSQQAAFERARSAWLRVDSEGVAPPVTYGDSPRPWLAVEPWSPPEQVSPATARSVLIDLAEGVWQVESAGWSPPPREWFRVDPATDSGAVYWPVIADSTTSGVKRVGAVGYELLTGETVPEAVVWPGPDDPPALWQVVETALTSPGTYGNCYELKRALLFGPTTPLSGVIAEAPDSESDSTDADAGRIGAQLSRRAAVGVLGLGALGVTGLFARGTDTRPGTALSQEDGPPAVSFGFAQNRRTLEVRHEGGDAIRAGRLLVVNPRVSGTNSYQWDDFEGYEASTLVRDGDSIVIDRGVLSMWFVNVVWKPPDGGENVVLEERKISEEDPYG